MVTSSLLTRAARVRPADLRTVARAYGWLLVAWIVLLIGGFPAMQRLIGLRPSGEPERERGERPVVSDAAARALRVTWKLLAPKLLHVTCLPRAIVLERTMAAHGMAAELVLGAVTDEGFRAHAWTEMDGHVVGWNEGGPASWRPLARFDSAAARAIRLEGARA